MEQHDEIMRALGELQGTTKKIDSRLDILNGSVATLKVNQAYYKGMLTVVGCMVGLIVVPVLGWSLVQTVSTATKVQVVQAQIKTLTTK